MSKRTVLFRIRLVLVHLSPEISRSAPAYFSCIFFSAVVNLIGLPYISVPKRNIFAARIPAPTQNTASNAPDTIISHISTLPMEIRISMPLLEVNGIKEAARTSRLLLSFSPMIAIKKEMI